MVKINNIILDSREGRKHRAKEYYDGKIKNIQIEALTTGDYVFDNTVVFEYKEISDFFSSLSNKSIFQECFNQSLQYDFHFVIIEGNEKEYLKKAYYIYGKKTGLRYSKFLYIYLQKFYGAIRRLRTITNVIQVEKEEQAFEEMLLQSEKCLDGKSKYYGGIVRQIESQDVIDIVLTSCSGISAKKAEAIREHYDLKGLDSLFDLNEKDFSKVRGIGEKTATKIYKYIHQ